MKIGSIVIAGVALAVAGSVSVRGAPTVAKSPALATGATLYQTACAYCHGLRGQGNVRLSAPKLWGPGNIVSGGAYGSLAALTQFIAHNMPLQPVNGINPGSLSPAQAHSLAQYIRHQGA